ncbi:competence protein CoiA [Lactococcus insecticola]|uniref:Competence protein CoiA n=1 Tax=Pseudolactococcus insecticola TaxID=2709158 RepID=A0A6A0B3T1_9LACT|nr:competence protein CoiA family protein [Lactococcus insecticola]GFH39812.1 competence protein CoiA [Lactococcus insecticola]
MLVALDEKDRIVNTLELASSDFTDLSDVFLRCPACKSQVRLKHGQIKLPHFAHVSLDACQSFSENESVQHLTLKKRLYHWFKADHQKVEVEYFLSELNQTPDLLVNDRIAIEIQCSPLSVKRLGERTETYRAHGYQVIWLMGRDLWLSDKMTVLKENLTYFSENAGFYYWELDLTQACLRLKSMIHQDLTGKIYYHTQTFDFGTSDLLEILRSPFQAQRMKKLAVPELKNLPEFIARQLYFQNPKWLKIQEKYYVNGENLLLTGEFPVKLAPLGLNPLTVKFDGVLVPDFCQIPSEASLIVNSYYQLFLAKFDGKTVYPPAFYKKI